MPIINTNCHECKHEYNDDVCRDCSVNNSDWGCSCHINPPCSYCEGNKFEDKEV